MICKSFEELTIVERRELIGKITHLVQTYENAFSVLQSIVRQAEQAGLFEGINFNQDDLLSNATA